ncbi:unnamed protein product [Musa textilis]
MVGPRASRLIAINGMAYGDNEAWTVEMRSSTIFGNRICICLDRNCPNLQSPNPILVRVTSDSYYYFFLFLHVYLSFLLHFFFRSQVADANQLQIGKPDDFRINLLND